MENPYSPPLSDLTSQVPKQPSSQLATRSDRFWASIIDGMVLMVFNLPVLYFLGFLRRFEKGDFSTANLLSAALTGIVVYVAVNGWLLARNGQTVGKHLRKIRIVSTSGGPVPFWRLLLLRQIPVQILGSIPILGRFAVFVDIMFIFRQDHRCIHDLVAGTRVVALADNAR